MLNIALTNSKPFQIRDTSNSGRYGFLSLKWISCLMCQFHRCVTCSLSTDWRRVSFAVGVSRSGIPSGTTKNASKGRCHVVEIGDLAFRLPLRKLCYSYWHEILQKRSVLAAVLIKKFETVTCNLLSDKGWNGREKPSDRRSLLWLLSVLLFLLSVFLGCFLSCFLFLLFCNL